MNVSQLIMLPIHISITTYLLWQYLGWASLAGMASIFLFMPINYFFGSLTKNIGKKKYKLQDARIKTMSEVLTGIRVVKSYGWEVYFMKLVKKLRGKELKSILNTSLLSALSNLSLGISTFAVAGISFATFIYIDDKNQLNPNIAFVSLTIINMFRNNLKSFPKVITSLINLNVSITRIRTFLLKEEINSENISHEPMNEYSIRVDNVDLGWSKNEEEKLLRNLNIKVKKGSLVAIVGNVGTGKSSLLAGLVNEMHILNKSGKINIDGKIALVTQQAWIQNATVKKNILFNNSYDKEFYKRVLVCCSLLPDLKIMPEGDDTEIGEKGK
jgi:ATP-binding cassette, subfamily C (CFTR/MRP), member 1